MLRIGFKASMVAAVAAAGLLAACSSGGGSSSSSPAPSSSGAPTSSSAPTTSAAPKDITIGVSFYTERIPIYATMHEGVQAKADELGVNVVFTDANGEEATQSDQLANFVTKGVAAIICSPADATALVPAYKAARDAGVFMISAGNKVADDQEDAFVGPDLVDYAKQTMDKLIEAMGGKGDIMIISGPPQIAFVQLQQKGWDASLAAHPDVKVIATGVDDDLSPAKALDVAPSLLSANPSVKGVMSSTDNISVGVIQAMEGLGIDPATVSTAGWDAQADAVKLVTEGKYTLTLSYLAYQWGEVALQTAVDMVNGKMPASHYVTTPGLFIDKANAASLTPDQISGKTAL